MSDLSSVSVFNSASPQLSPEWYFDPAIFEIEKRVLFDRGPGYATLSGGATKGMTLRLCDASDD
mgnify:CR=1 FL=1